MVLFPPERLEENRNLIESRQVANLHGRPADASIPENCKKMPSYSYSNCPCCASSSSSSEAQIISGCCPGRSELPATLTVTVTSSCPNCSSVTFPITYSPGSSSPGNPWWIGSTTDGNGFHGLTLQCQAADDYSSGFFAFIGSICGEGGSFGSQGSPGATLTCTPFLLTVPGVTIPDGPCAGGTYDITISE